MIVFDKLWEVMKEKNISQYKLINDYGISPAQLTRLKRNENVKVNILNTLCEILDCNIFDIMEYVKEDSRKI
ncbi:MAG: helix-turn-helix transcriptional regulator [Candidatus Gastranaerophilales bacterium]|nr:helix-turn-helix transcriptional regulator [Candidatus Gastranaerophilales bacterium]